MVTTVVNTGSQSSLLRGSWAGLGLEGALGGLLRAGVGEERGEGRHRLAAGRPTQQPLRTGGQLGALIPPFRRGRQTEAPRTGVCVSHSKAHMYPYEQSPGTWLNTVC